MFVAMGLFANCLINCLMLGGNVIECVNSYKILGVIIIDEDLKWNSHVKYFSKKAYIKSYIRPEHCVLCRGVPRQHPEDLSKHGATSPRVRGRSLAGHSCLPLRCYRASSKKGTLHNLT